MDLHRLGTAILEARTKKKMTQEEVADIAGVSPSTISNMEQGLHTPTLNMLSAVLPPLDLDPTEFLA